MPTKPALTLSPESRRSERGAALITVLLLSTLLFTAGGVLILTTSLSATNAIDATAEMQTYYAAEAGLQRSLNILRSHDLPAGSIPGGKSKLDFRDVVLNPTLAGWLPADGPVIGGTQTTLVGTNAFSVNVIDPDDQGPVLTRKITLNPKYKPSRIVFKVVGYGPKMARKFLNMTVIYAGLKGFTAPATITLRGSDEIPAPPLTFDTGDSNAARYTGNDKAGKSGISAFAVTAPDVAPALAGIQKPSSQIIGPPVSVLGTSTIPGVPPTPQPEWLNTAEDARSFVDDLRLGAQPNRYFLTQPDVSQMGLDADGNMQTTFVEGDVDLGSGNQGSGLLIVTGKLTMTGNTSFNGIIMVLGGGSVERSGGGDGVISGGIVVAKFDATGDFLAPTFTTSGGGTSLIQYNSDSVTKAANTVPGFLVIGVVEK
ncbi:MAG TPA: hypothetical protein VF723_09050 [Pyrinomonadaceae bacterium]|jgi:hypothetical protein